MSKLNRRRVQGRGAGRLIRDSADSDAICGPQTPATQAQLESLSQALSLSGPVRAAPAAAPGQLSHGPVRRQLLVARRRAGRGNHSRLGRWRSRGWGPAGPAGGGRRGQAGRQVELLAGPAAPGPRPGPAPGAAAAHWQPGSSASAAAAGLRGNFLSSASGAAVQVSRVTVPLSLPA